VEFFCNLQELESLANFVTSNGSGDHVDEANSGQVRQGKPNPTLGEGNFVAIE